MKTTLRNLILGLIVFVILLILVGTNMLRAIREADSSCQALIARVSRTPNKISKELLMGKCDPDFVQIAPDHISVNGILERVPVDNKMKINFDSNDESQLSNAIYYAFATQLAKCWQLSLEGKARIGTGEETVGLICSKISFTNPLRNKNLIFSDLLDYLSNTNLPDKEITYKYYFLEEEYNLEKFTFPGDITLNIEAQNLPVFTKSNDEYIALNQADFKINTSKHYYVLFFSKYEGDKPPYSFVFIVDNEELDSLLDKKSFEIIN